MVEEKISEEEVGKMVHSKLDLKTICCLCVWRNHHAGIVDEDINMRLFLQNFGCKLTYRLKRGQVNLDKDSILRLASFINLRDGSLAFLLAATGQDDPGTPSRQIYSCFQAYACVSSSYDDSLASEQSLRLADTSTKISFASIQCSACN